jgi:Nanos RNA binding domain
MDYRHFFLKKPIKMISTKNTVTAAKKTPYCDTCYLKGLSEREYSSHYTKSEPGPRGVVVCPTILNSLCRACGGKGHWANEKFCPLMRREARIKDREQKVVPVPVVVKKTNQNRFAVLIDDEGEAVVVAPVVVAPVVVAPVVVAPDSKRVSWSDMARKPAVLVTKEEPSPLTTLSFQTVYYSAKNHVVTRMTDAEKEAIKIFQERKASGCFDKKSKCPWLEDSDDEEEEE